MVLPLNDSQIILLTINDMIDFLYDPEGNLVDFRILNTLLIIMARGLRIVHRRIRVAFPAPPTVPQTGYKVREVSVMTRRRRRPPGAGHRVGSQQRSLHRGLRHKGGSHANIRSRSSSHKSVGSEAAGKLSTPRKAPSHILKRKAKHAREEPESERSTETEKSYASKASKGSTPSKASLSVKSEKHTPHKAKRKKSYDYVEKEGSAFRIGDRTSSDEFSETDNRTPNEKSRESEKSSDSERTRKTKEREKTKDKETVTDKESKKDKTRDKGKSKRSREDEESSVTDEFDKRSKGTTEKGKKDDKKLGREDKESPPSDEIDTGKTPSKGSKDEKKKSEKKTGGTGKSAADADEDEESSAVSQKQKSKPTEKEKSVSGKDKSEKSRAGATVDEKGRPKKMSSTESMTAAEGKKKKPPVKESESEADDIQREKILIVEPEPLGREDKKPRKLQPGADESDQSRAPKSMVTMEQFQKLARSVDDLVKRFGPIDVPGVGDSSNLLKSLNEGVSLTDPMAIVQLSARLEAVEAGLNMMTSVLVNLNAQAQKGMGSAGTMGAAGGFAGAGGGAYGGSPAGPGSAYGGGLGGPGATGGTYGEGPPGSYGPGGPGGPSAVVGAYGGAYGPGGPGGPGAGGGAYGGGAPGGTYGGGPGGPGGPGAAGGAYGGGPLGRPGGPGGQASGGGGPAGKGAKSGAGAKAGPAGAKGGTEGGGGGFGGLGAAESVGGPGAYGVKGGAVGPESPAGTYGGGPRGHGTSGGENAGGAAGGPGFAGTRGGPGGATGGPGSAVGGPGGVLGDPRAAKGQAGTGGVPGGKDFEKGAKGVSSLDESQVAAGTQLAEFSQGKKQGKYGVDETTSVGSAWAGQDMSLDISVHSDEEEDIGGTSTLSTKSKTDMATEFQLRKKMQDLKDQVLKHFVNAIKKLETSSVNANKLIKIIDGKLSISVKLEEKVDALIDLITEYGLKITEVDRLIANTMTNYQEELTQMQHELEIGLDNMAEALANRKSDSDSGFELNNHFTALRVDIERTLIMQNDLDAIQDTLNMDLQDMDSQIEGLQFLKSDRDEVEQALATKAGINEFNGMVSLQQYEAVRGDFQKRIIMSFDKFNNQEILWQKCIDELARCINDKAEKHLLDTLEVDIKKHQGMLQGRLDFMLDICGTPRLRTDKKGVRREGPCLSCSFPFKQKEETIGHDTKAFDERPKPIGAKTDADEETNADQDGDVAEICYPSGPITHPLDNRAKVCSRFCGGPITEKTAKIISKDVTDSISVRHLKRETPAKKGVEVKSILTKKPCRICNIQPRRISIKATPVAEKKKDNLKCDTCGCPPDIVGDQGPNLIVEEPGQ